MTAEQRQARQSAVVGFAEEFAHGRGPMHPLNPEWDGRVLDILDRGDLSEVDRWSNEWIAGQAGNSAHEIRTWIAAFAALASQGSYETSARYYRAAPELIAGFAVRTARLAGE
jgi:2,3-dihydroxyphenylpropionate 1,2-dioxygenase